MRTRRWKSAATACAAAVLLAGCGSAAEERERESDDARAKAALITREDLPADWSPMADTDGDAVPSKAELAQMCPGYPAEWLVFGDLDAEVSFEASSATLMHGIMIEADVARAREQFDDIDSARARNCMTGVVEWSLRSGLDEMPDADMEIGRVKVAPLEPGDGQRGMRADIVLSVGEAKVPVQADMVVTERNGAISTVMLMGVGAPVDEELRDRLAAAASERLDEQFG